MKKYNQLIFTISLLILALTGRAADRQSHVVFQPDTTRILRNPLSGWVLYMGRNWDASTYSRLHYDQMPTSEGSYVNVADYASACYIRTSWAAMEPKEGEYFWNDPESRLSQLLRSMRQRGLQLAFRIVVDSYDQGQNTPLYVRDCGAKGIYNKNNNSWSPYPDDPVFQKKYAKFIKAFAKEFDDDSKVAFVDAFGLGKWGESHGLRYANYSNKNKVFDWITSLYQNTFVHVPLLINYHRLVGDTISWAAPNSESDSLLCSAINKGYSLRHDAFGMTDYYQQWERDFAKRFTFVRPIIFEGGWITGGQHRYWIDSCGKYRKGHPEDVRDGEMEAAEEAHVNMMDFRVGDETVSWFGKAFNLVKYFATHGGYRLYPQIVTYDKTIHVGNPIRISAKWKNIGWGYCPTNIPQWNQKYKLGYALCDSHNRVVKRWVDIHSDLSTWLPNRAMNNKTVLRTDGMKTGRYSLLTAIVDVTKQNNPAIEIAVDRNLFVNGWLKLGEITLK